MQPFRIGLDVGSTTLKVVLLDQSDGILFARYARHRSDIRGELIRAFEDLLRDFPGVCAPVHIAGSAGLGLSEVLRLPFEQEVAAATRAVRRFAPEVEVVIELGGEDAKITFLKPYLSQRMNGTCAGGTGSFIDQMASLLQTDADGLNELAKGYQTLHTIASRCGVFAKSDMQPLINQGARHEDLAASVFAAVATQTIAGLACGQPIEGLVAFLGGPLSYMSELRAAFERALPNACFVTPVHAELFVAIGAAMGAKGAAVTPESLLKHLKETFVGTQEIPRMPTLFASQEDRAAFNARHAAAAPPTGSLRDAQGSVFIGIDAGSTTTKAVAVDREGRLLYSYYDSNHGAPLHRAQDIAREIYENLPSGAFIGRACVTGYGEALLKVALEADEGEIETLAHVKAAQAFDPDVDFVLDIGGQDMKCIRIKDGLIDSILLNEACSSGCGSFLSTFADSLGHTAESFAQEALKAQNPMDLGTRCTVFMNSRVKQAQKEGAQVGDISAGLAYAVVRNALYKVIGLKSPADLGQKPVVQGGTFLNDAVLRAFETVSGREAVRPSIAGLMGAYGAALLARERWDGQTASSFLPAARLDEILPVSTKNLVCAACPNACRLTLAQFSQGRRLVSGHRCEKGQRLSEKTQSAQPAVTPPNMAEEKYERLFAYTPLPEDKAPRGVIGIPRVLNLYENYPLWFTFFTALGFSVRLSGKSDHALFQKGMHTIPSESVCYPAKLVHGHIQDLADAGVKTIFYPCIPYEQKENEDAGNCFNCPIVTSYPEVISANMDVLAKEGITFLKPFFALDHPNGACKVLFDALASYRISLPEVKKAWRAAVREQMAFKDWVVARGQDIVKELEQTNGLGLVFAGRPYHIDPEIHHGLPNIANALGFAVLTEDAVSPRQRVTRPLRVFDQWMYHTRLYDAASFVVNHPNLEMVQLNSFGCGLDAITTDQVRDLLTNGGKTCTLLKIDEISNLGAARIRLRSLQVALRQRDGCTKPAISKKDYHRIEFTPAMRKQHTIIAPQMSPVHFTLIEAVLRRAGYHFVVLEKAAPEDIDLGLQYVNNDACYPTLVVVGQLLGALTSGQYDPDNTTIFLTQTGGGCRATNYVSLMRRALADAGFPQVPVVGLSVSGIEKNSGLKLSASLLIQTIRAVIVGDLLQLVLLRTRPYESVPDSANTLYHKFLDKAIHYFATPKKGRFRTFLREIVSAFDALPLRSDARKPRVGLVGEILVKFHPDANNNAIGVLEEEGCEVMVPGLLNFFQYCFHNIVIRKNKMGFERLPAFIMSLVTGLIDRMEKPARRLLEKSSRFSPYESIKQLAKRAESVLSLCNQCGEGWLLTAEILELVDAGAPNVLCVQPFACLPNHVTGKGMIREIRKQFPLANIVPVDYDPGASEVNQLNRIKLMVSTARHFHGDKIVPFKP